MTKKIYLIRHGMTEANEKRIYCGISDLPLSEKGIEMLTEKKAYYQALISDKAKHFTTGMRRTEQTLEILFESNGEVPEHGVVTGFKEISFGIFELKSYAELKNDIAYIEWISGDYENNVPPNGESGAEMSKRVLNTFYDWLGALEEESALICHGGTVYYIMRHLFPEEDKTLYEWEPKNGCGYCLELSDDKWTYTSIG